MRGPLTVVASTALGGAKAGGLRGGAALSGIQPSGLSGMKGRPWRWITEREESTRERSTDRINGGGRKIFLPTCRVAV
jgi:hypothetical protein